jgi:histidinol-phosphate aminotransferase
VLAFTGPGKSYVVADPGYEAGERAARFIGAKTISIPLRKDYAHDVNAMAQADPEAGLIYVCNPNNPTGSITPKEDIEYLVAHKPKDSVVLLDEAYIHLSKTAQPATALVAAGKDVIILRTFSKLYGMAGLRAGAAFGRPDLLSKLRSYGAGALPATGMVGALASLKVKGLVQERREIIAETREQTASWLVKKGFAVLPSEANMLMVGVKRPGREVFQALLKEKVVIGRSWPSMPDYVRITVGTRDEMAKFRSAFERVMNV